MSSDHFAPWSERQGRSGFAWSWLGAAPMTAILDEDPGHLVELLTDTPTAAWTWPPKATAGTA